LAIIETPIIGTDSRTNITALQYTDSAHMETYQVWPGHFSIFWVGLCTRLRESILESNQRCIMPNGNVHQQKESQAMYAFQSSDTHSL